MTKISSAFQSYAQLTAVELLLGVQVRLPTALTQPLHSPSTALTLPSFFTWQVRNLVFLSWFFRNNLFIYSMFGLSCLTMLYLCIFPNDKPAIDDDDDIP